MDQGGNGGDDGVSRVALKCPRLPFQVAATTGKLARCRRQDDSSRRDPCHASHAPFDRLDCMTVADACRENDSNDSISYRPSHSIARLTSSRGCLALMDWPRD